ncbi:hypothetical protein GCM10020001_090060 [Nonomuraea salmonea]
MTRLNTSAVSATAPTAAKIESVYAMKISRTSFGYAVSHYYHTVQCWRQALKGKVPGKPIPPASRREDHYVKGPRALPGVIPGLDPEAQSYGKIAICERPPWEGRG